MKVERLTQRDIVVKFSRKHLVELAWFFRNSVGDEEHNMLPDLVKDFIKFVNDNLGKEK